LYKNYLSFNLIAPLENFTFCAKNTQRENFKIRFFWYCSKDGWINRHKTALIWIFPCIIFKARIEKLKFESCWTPLRQTRVGDNLQCFSIGKRLTEYLLLKMLLLETLWQTIGQ